MSRTPPTNLSSNHVYSPAPSSRLSKIKKPIDLLPPLRLNRMSAQTHYSTADKAKTPIRGGDSEIHDSYPSISHAETDVRDKFVSHDAHATPRPTDAGERRHSFASAPKRRGSLLVAASDALSFKFGRKRQTAPARGSSKTMWLPDIIEITAHHTDVESQERERIREEAAQSLGISVDQDARSLSQSTENDDQGPDKHTSHISYFDNAASTRSNQTWADISNYSTKSLPSPTRHSVFDSRRPGSTMTHYRRTSNSPHPIPSFPASVDALQEFKQLSALLPKYHAPSNLRIFTFTKNWKIRHVVLTSPNISTTSNAEPAVSYLHIFKSSAAGERELERLEINENSVIFIAEEDVGGRRRVVKVGDKEGTNPKRSRIIEDGRVTWFFDIPDVLESQKWIAAIKNVILGQRTLRAGLALPPQVVNGIEPRGDMDVMLSIRQQGIVTTPSTLRQCTSSPQSTDHSGNYASSISSQSVKSQTTGPKTPPPASPASGGLRSLFMSRPRATSRATSFDSERESDPYLSMGHLISKLRPSTAESQRANDKSFVPPLSSFTSATHSLQRRIVNEHPQDLLSSKVEGEEHSSPKTDRASRASSLGALSLHPPPRKRRGSEAIMVSISPMTPTFPEAFDEAVLRQDSQPHEEFPSNQRFSHFGSPQQRPRVQSAHSVSTIASADIATSQERSSVSTKRSSRRWSRQSVLPARPSPPSGPPPPTPSSTHLQPHPYAGEQGITRTPSNQSDGSIIPGFASFSSKSSKRTSTASAFSVKSGTSQSLSSAASRSSHPSPSHRPSIPPSKPPPTSALPPAPNQATSAPSTESLFRESVTVRVGRLSVVSPKPAPITALPSSPSEAKSHRRASSGSYFARPANSNPSTSSLSFIPSPTVTPPFPPPSGPLPPTPKTRTPRHSITIPSPSPTLNENSIMRRLRMLSTPSTPPPAVHEKLPGDIPTESSRPRSNTVTTPIVHSPKPVLASLIAAPVAPIAEKIISFQDDPSFLQFDTPTLPSLPPPRALSQIADQPVEMTSLSPPPRRGSRQILPSEIAIPDGGASSTPTPKPHVTDGERRLISLSRPGSVVSLGIVSM